MHSLALISFPSPLPRPHLSGARCGSWRVKSTYQVLGGDAVSAFRGKPLQGLESSDRPGPRGGNSKKVWGWGTEEEIPVLVVLFPDQWEDFKNIRVYIYFFEMEGC